MEKILRVLYNFFASLGAKATTPPPMPIQPTQPPPAPPVQDPDFLYPDWHDPKHNHHNVRAICDLEGLDGLVTIDGVQYTQKQVLTACVYQESQFYNWRDDGTPLIHQNRSGRGTVLSTDYGIVQVNDYYHIGNGKDFVSVDYVINNPEAAVRWMCHYYKRNGHLNAWVSYTSGAFKQWLKTV